MENKENLWPHEGIYLDNINNPQLPASHREDYARALAIASMLGDEVGPDGEEFKFVMIKSADEIGPSPQINLIQNDLVGLERYDEVEEVEFKVDPKSLSGKVDAAHAVLPGTLTVNYEGSSDDSRDIPVVVKGSFKREFEDRMERLKKEITISQMQIANGEIGFQPIAAVIAPPVYAQSRSREPQNEILLLTHFESSAVSMDNAPWSLGFTKENLEAAERAASALGRFNTTVGIHGDAKIKNIVQQPDGATSMIDFETSEIIPNIDAVEARHIVSWDLGMLMDSLVKKNFFADAPERAFEVVEKLSEVYLEQWEDMPEEVVDAVYQEAINIAEQYRNYYGKSLDNQRVQAAA